MNLPSFAGDLVAWYARSKRDFPWRKTRDPYKIWVSEIMLQQTRTEVVRDYYTRFVKRFPTIASLADAKIDEVLRIWQGLGYYARARNLHCAAGVVLAKYKGRLPCSYGELRSLPGIGEYTAGAILSIAFGEPFPAIDGNVVRVISRIAKIRSDPKSKGARKNIQLIVQQELQSSCNPSHFNQALMDLSSMVCLPSSPTCGHCPLKKICRAHAAGLEGKIPKKANAAKSPIVGRFAAYIKTAKGVLLAKRPDNGLLAGFWELPGAEAKSKLSFERAFLSTYGAGIKAGKQIGRLNHVFSHQVWDTRIVACEIQSPISSGKRPARFFTDAEIRKIPLPKAIRAMLNVAAERKK